MTLRPDPLRPVLPILALAVALGCSGPDGGNEPASVDGAGEPTRPVPEDAPRLVLQIVVDQMRGDYLDRFADLFDGGLARLREEGQIFVDAHQDHAFTSTSPGHATIATGTRPATHGIVGNNWFERSLGEEVYSVEDEEDGRSPRRLLVPTWGDRLKETWPAARVFAVGGKDRSTVLTAGHRADGAYWYDGRTGRFRTSTFYRPAGDDGEIDLPDWLDAFHERGWVDQWFGASWSTDLGGAELEAHDVTPLDRGAFSRSLPYPFGGPALHPGSSYYAGIYASPWMDAYVTELAKTILDTQSLGDDAIPDLLAVNYSSTDAVGHTFGPDSPELADNLVRLDDTLGDLLDHVDRTIGLDRVLVVLSSDHGVGQVPEVARARGRDAARLGTDAALCIQNAGERVAVAHGLEGAEWMPEIFYFDRAVLEERGADLAAVRADLAEELRSCPRIERVFEPADIESAGDADAIATLFRRGYRADRNGDLELHLQADTLATSTTASHGTAHRYDTWVPLVFRVPGAAPARFEVRASVTDIAPTVAADLGLPGGGFEGTNRLPLLLEEAGGDAETPTEPAAATAPQ